MRLGKLFVCAGVCLGWPPSAGCREPLLGAGEAGHERHAHLTLRPSVAAGVGAIPIGALCLGEGSLRATPEQTWVSTSPTLRAAAPNTNGNHAAITFRYLGAAQRRGQRAPDVDDGQQLGLRLLSRDACNAVTVTWHFGVRSSVVASIQTNPGRTRRAECGTLGQHDLRPFWLAPVKAPELDSVHELSATIRRGLLEVRIDERPVLRAVVAGRHAPESGSSGLHSDNARFELIRFEGDASDAAPSPAAHCR